MNVSPMENANSTKPMPCAGMVTAPFRSADSYPGMAGPPSRTHGETLRTWIGTSPGLLRPRLSENDTFFSTAGPPRILTQVKTGIGFRCFHVHL